MKDQGKTSKAPLTEAFGNWSNGKIVLIALVGAVAGQAVVWYTGQFYALFFLEKTLKVDGATVNILIAIALALATPFFVGDGEHLLRPVVSGHGRDHHAGLRAPVPARDLQAEAFGLGRAQHLT